MGPKTIRGNTRKLLSGDGRKNPSTPYKEIFGINKKRKKRR